MQRTALRSSSAYVSKVGLERGEHSVPVAVQRMGRVALSRWQPVVVNDVPVPRHLQLQGLALLAWQAASSEFGAVVGHRRARWLLDRVVEQLPGSGIDRGADKSKGDRVG